MLINDRPVTGFSGGGFPPVGYRAVRVETGRKKGGEPRVNAYWVPDETVDQWGETPWARVQRAWEMMATGHTHREIEDACHLYNSLNAYSDFFRRRTYLGIRVCGEVEVPDAHPAAFDQATFERIQLLLDSRLRPKRHPEVAASPYLLSGLIVCGYCGDAVVGQSDPRRPDTRIYMCYGKKRKGKTCRLKRCPAWLLEETILDTVRARVLTPAYQTQLLEEINAGIWAEGETLTTEIERVERQMQTVERRLGNLLDMIEEQGRTSTLAARLAERDRERAELTARRTHLRDRLTRERPRPVTEDELRAVLGELRAALTEQGTVAQARRALEYLLVPRGSKLFDEAVELQYTFPVPASSPLTGTGVVPPAGYSSRTCPPRRPLSANSISRSSAPSACTSEASMSAKFAPAA